MTCLNLKLLSYFANGIQLIFAVILITLGVQCSKIPGPEIDASSPSIVVGSFLIFLTLLGIAAFKLQQTFLTIIYLLLLTCIIAYQLVLGASILNTDGNLKIRSFLITSYAAKTVNDTNANILEFQTFFRCCGLAGPDGNDVRINGPAYISRGIRETVALIDDSQFKCSLRATGNEKQKLINGTYLIPECCPQRTSICTKLDAFKDACLVKIKRSYKEWEQTMGAFLLTCCFVLIMVAALGIKYLTQM